VRIKWLRRALLDLDEVEQYIAQDNPTAAAALILKIVRSISLLQEQPGAGRPGRVPGTKELVVPETPYIVPYRVKEGAIQILRVYHASRKWQNRF
jgi:addiction module RelE/StbE family toxin